MKRTSIGHTRDNDIWKDVTCMKLLHEGTLPDTVDLEECKRTRKMTLNYQWTKDCTLRVVYAKARRSNGTNNPNA
jgi:hypothetical protein